MSTVKSIYFDEYNLKSSFNTMMRVIIESVRVEIENATGRPLALKYFPNRHDEEFNSVTSWFLSGGGKEQYRSRFSTRVQLDIRVRDDETVSREVIASMIGNGIDSALNFAVDRNAFYARFNVFDYVTDKVAPQRLNEAQIEPFLRNGWQEHHDDDVTVLRTVNIYKILYRSR